MTSPLRGSLGKLQIRSLSLLAAIIEQGSVRRAAKHMRLSQPSASRMVSELEAVFNCELFTRTSRGMIPNARAIMLYQSSTVVLRALATAEQELKSEIPRSVVVVGALPVVIVELLAKVIGRLGREYPNMVVKIRPEASSRLFVALAEGELDCVIARLPQAGAHGESYEAIRKVLSGLHVEVLYEEPQCLIVGKAHPLARKKRVSWKEMAKERWLRPVSEGGVHRVIADGFASAGHSVPPASVECEHFMYAIRIVAESDLLAVVPRHEALRFADMVTPLPLPERITAAPIVFATRKADADDAIIAAFRRVVGSVAATFKRDSARR